jgi:hypothetical protein
MCEDAAMHHPFQSIPKEALWKILIPLTLITLTLMIIMNWISTPLATAAAPNGIISYELAGSIEAVRAILASWVEETKLFAAFSLGLDYLFLVVYSSTIGMGCIWASRLFSNGLSFLGTMGVLLAWGQWLAALMDGVENAALLKLLLGDIHSSWPQIARICAIIKFTLIVLGLTYVIIAGLFKWIKRVRLRA